MGLYGPRPYGTIGTQVPWAVGTPYGHGPTTLWDYWATILWDYWAHTLSHGTVAHATWDYGTHTVLRTCRPHTVLRTVCVCVWWPTRPVGLCDYMAHDLMGLYGPRDYCHTAHSLMAHSAQDSACVGVGGRVCARVGVRVCAHWIPVRVLLFSTGTSRSPFLSTGYFPAVVLVLLLSLSLSLLTHLCHAHSLVPLVSFTH